MRFLRPRAVYHRTNTDEPNSNDDTVELVVRDRTDDWSLAEPPSSPKTNSVAWLAIGTYEANLVLRRDKSGEWLSGWRFGAVCAAATGTVSLVINIIAIAWLMSHKNKTSGLVEVYTGDCGKVRTMGLWTHLTINLLSTLLLGGSNYCMQCLVSPTRGEVDKAHAQGKYLDIGVPNTRNLRLVATRKSRLWWILALSSVPLHFLYNSAFYSALPTNDYDIFMSTPIFVNGANFTTTVPSTAPPIVSMTRVAAESGGNYHRIETADCIKAYAESLLADRRNLILVADNMSDFITDPTADPILLLDFYEFATGNPGRATDYGPFNWGVGHHKLCSGC